MATKEKEWRSRIVGHGEAEPEQLLANPRNWRIHPHKQQSALLEALDKIGWVQEVVVNRITDHVVDGHLRVQLAISKGERTIPVQYVELDEEEERIVLATLDPLAELAVVDDGALKGLLGDLNGQLGPELARLMREVAPTVTAPGGFLGVSDEQIEAETKRLEEHYQNKGPLLVDVICPHCTEEFAVNVDELH